MFAEKAESQPATGLNETALVELTGADIDEVSGAVAPLVAAAAWWAARTVAQKWLIGSVGAAGAGGAGYGVGYWANRH